MTTTPSIINCQGVVMITMKIPEGTIADLIPPVGKQMRMGVEVKLRFSLSDQYFIVLISDLHIAGEHEGVSPLWRGNVHAVIQHVWDQMVNRGIVTGQMPYIVEGNPLDMVTR